MCTAACYMIMTMHWNPRSLLESYTCKETHLEMEYQPHEGIVQRTAATFGIAPVNRRSSPTDDVTASGCAILDAATT